MIQFIQNYLRRRKKKIFRFWDGQRYRTADPEYLRRTIVAHKRFDPLAHLLILDKDDAFGREAYNISLDAIREIFSLKPYDGDTETGSTEEEVFDVWLQYVMYVGNLKKSTKGLLTTLQPSDLDRCREAMKSSWVSN